MNKKLTALIVYAITLLSSSVIATSDVNSKLKAKFTELDNILFEESFNQCRLEVLTPIISEDFEFYHDVAGIQDRKGFLQAVRQNICSNMDHKPLRKLVPGSMQLFPLNQDGKIYGMIQRGIHEFYIKEKDRSPYKTGIAKFTHLWILQNNQWVLKRVLSFDHQASTD